jgi:hypothetical protein
MSKTVAIILAVLGGILLLMSVLDLVWGNQPSITRILIGVIILIAGVANIIRQ